MWKVIGARLESVYTVKGIVGSNPTLSAILKNIIDFNIKDSYIYVQSDVLFNKLKGVIYGMGYTRGYSRISLLFKSIKIF